MFASALLLLTGLALSECRVLSQKLDAWNESDDHGKIVNGVAPRPNAYPFIVRLNIEVGLEGYLCGGALINSQWILTAAHCFDFKKGKEITEIRIFLGSHNVLLYEPNMIEMSGEYFMHADYHRYNNANDIALVRLSRPVTFNKYMSPVCIARTGTYSVGQNATVAGWGLIGTNKTVSSVLLEIGLPILDDRTCERKYRYDRDVMMCAGYTDGSKDTCEGDSGGPLFVRGNKGYTVVGVVSFGTKVCAERGYPSVFAKVEHFTEWIQKTAASGGSICIV